MDIIAYALLIIGAISWGWVGFFGFDPVALLLGNMTRYSRFVYSIISLAAIYDLLSLPSIFKRWEIHLKRPAEDSGVIASAPRRRPPLKAGIDSLASR